MPDITARDIPASVLHLALTAPRVDSYGAVPLHLSQVRTAELLAHYWPAIEAHFRDLLADEIGATSQRLLYDIPESTRSPRDWDQREEWLEAASTIRRPADAAAAVPARTGGE